MEHVASDSGIGATPRALPGARDTDLHQGLLRDLVRSLSRRGVADPEDVASEAVYRALRKVADGADTRQAGLRGYSFGIAKLVAKERARAARRSQQLDVQEWRQVESGDRDVERIEARLLLGQVRAALDARQWSILRAYASDPDHRRLCAALGITPGTLRVAIHRIRRTLKAELGPGATALSARAGY